MSLGSKADRDGMVKSTAPPILASLCPPTRELGLTLLPGWQVLDVNLRLWALLRLPEVPAFDPTNGSLWFSCALKPQQAGRKRCDAGVGAEPRTEREPRPLLGRVGDLWGQESVGHLSTPRKMHSWPVTATLSYAWQALPGPCFSQPSRGLLSRPAHSHPYWISCWHDLSWMPLYVARRRVGCGAGLGVGLGWHRSWDTPWLWVPVLMEGSTLNIAPLLILAS